MDEIKVVAALIVDEVGLLEVVVAALAVVVVRAGLVLVVAVVVVVVVVKSKEEVIGFVSDGVLKAKAVVAT